MSKSASAIENEIERFITQYLIEHNTLDGKDLISLSLRLSYKPSINSRQIYVTLINTNFNLVNSNISDLSDVIKGRIRSRNIDIRTITSIHLHLHYN